ncbi:MAG: Omp28-related outer membrane protein [Bacteroidales bacterium]|nr:Omp28-related outer membrane protein [Bacteroidales bacterium]
MKPVASIFFAIVLMAAFSLNMFSQHYVPMEPLNKNVIYEEFTGVKCVNCPSGHAVLAQILAANPERAFVVAYHPFNSSYTLPYAGDPDFRRHYADSLYMTPWCGTSRYMPSAFVHRRLWVPGERLTERTNWVAYGNTIMSEPSPLNVGMATNYNSDTKILSVLVDVYYTAGISGSHNLMVTLAENNLQSQQLGATGIYTHKHTFRESFAGQWGDPLSDNTPAGTFHTRQFTFDNTTTNYNMENCELMAFVIDNTSEEVVSGIGCMVGDTTFITPDVSLSVDTLYFTTAVQCLDGLTAIIKNNTSIPLVLNDVQPASAVPSQINWVVDPWPFTTFPQTLNPGDSVNLTIHVALPVDNPLIGFYLDSLYFISNVDTRYLMIAVDQDLYTSVTGTGQTAIKAMLSNNYPNPFRTHTTFEYYNPVSSEVKLEIMNINGQLVRVLQSGKTNSGKHTVTWDGLDDDGYGLPEGIYLYRLTTDQQVITRRCIMMR